MARKRISTLLRDALNIKFLMSKYFGYLNNAELFVNTKRALSFAIAYTNFHDNHNAHDQ